MMLTFIIIFTTIFLDNRKESKYILKFINNFDKLILGIIHTEKMYDCVALCCDI